jgi:ribosome biogenesis GTPase A
MAINWYPGHMFKAKKELANAMGGTAVFIEVLDARTPYSSSNPMIREIRGDIPCLRILNKADLADSKISLRWQEYFNSLPGGACLINGLHNKLSTQSVLTACRKLLKSNKAAMKPPFQVVIAGVPNVGKSTLINQFADRKVAKTGNEPAVTKGQQRIKLDLEWYLLDTPGLLWPKFEDQEVGYRLACTGTIRNTAVEAEDIAWFAAELLLRDYWPALSQRYGLDIKPDQTEDLLQAIASVRGCISKRGKVDWHKTSEVLLNDFRSGKLGKLSLETPPPLPSTSNQPVPGSH